MLRYRKYFSKLMRAKLFIVLLLLLFLGVSFLVVFTTQQTLGVKSHEVASTPQPVGQTANWRERFDDEFNGTSLDTTKWNTCYPNFQVGADSCNHNNLELEIYQPDQVRVGNGVLTLRGERKTVNAGGRAFNYSSGMISSGPGANGSKAKFTFTYGFVEMRAKIPKGAGLWSAFWMLPADGGWPPEIDVQEILGNDPTAAHMTYHWGKNMSFKYWRGADFSAGWHTYATDWEPDAITWYIDGIERFSYTNANNIPSKPMYLLANLAIGGWPGSPHSSTPFPADYQIDYIHVWQKSATNDHVLPQNSTSIPVTGQLIVWVATVATWRRSRRSIVVVSLALDNLKEHRVRQLETCLKGCAGWRENDLK